MALAPGDNRSDWREGDSAPRRRNLTWRDWFVRLGDPGDLAESRDRIRSMTTVSWGLAHATRYANANASAHLLRRAWCEPPGGPEPVQRME